MTTVMIIVTVAEAQALIILVVLAMILDLLVLEMITVVDRVHLVEVIMEVLIILIFGKKIVTEIELKVLIILRLVILGIQMEIMKEM